MSENPTHLDNQKTRKSGAVTFGVFTAVVLVGQALGSALVAECIAVILGIPVRRLLVPYLVLVTCGCVLSPPLYWARTARRRPRVYAIRVAIAIFLDVQVFMLALGFGATRLGLVSWVEFLWEYAPFIPPFSAVVAALDYVAVRQMGDRAGSSG